MAIIIATAVEQPVVVPTSMSVARAILYILALPDSPLALILKVDVPSNPVGHEWNREGVGRAPRRTD